MMTMLLDLRGAYDTLQLAEARIVELEGALYNPGKLPLMEPEQQGRPCPGKCHP